MEDLRWWLAPSTGGLGIRLPCPACGWTEVQPGQTRLVGLDGDCALFTTECHEHGTYELPVDLAGGGYLDLTTMYRNVIKERTFARDTTTLHVVVKGGEWAPGSRLVDGAHATLGTPAADRPMWILSPPVLTDSGAPLSKSVIRAAGRAGFPGTEPWMLSTAHWPGGGEHYADSLLWLLGHLLSNPGHFFRSFTTHELQRLMASHTGVMALGEDRNGQ